MSTNYNNYSLIFDRKCLSQLENLKNNIWAFKRGSYVQEFLGIHLLFSAIVSGGVVLPGKALNIILVIVLLLLAI